MLTAQSPMESWLHWVAAEERVRCAWFAFMMDTENASLYRYAEPMSLVTLLNDATRHWQMV